MVEFEKEVKSTVTETKTFYKCDHCGQVLDEGEELASVYIGEPPQPKEQRLKATNIKSRGRKYGYKHSPAEYKALYKALTAAPNIDVCLSGYINNVDNTKLDVKRNDNRAAALITIQPQINEREPDLEVCEYCEESLQQ